MDARRPRRKTRPGPIRVSTRPTAKIGRSVEACTFDCYGTLIDWRAGIERTLGRAVRSRGYAGTRAIFSLYEEAEKSEEGRYAPYREVLASAATGAARQLGVALSAAQAAEFAESLPTWPVFPDTAGVLRELGRRGVQRFVLSNVDRDLLQETLRLHDLEVDGYVTAEDVGSYKPATDHWLRFFRDHPVDRGAVLHVAQSLFHDIVPAKGLGLRTVWVNRYREARPASVRPTYTVEDLRGLLDLVETPARS